MNAKIDINKFKTLVIALALLAFSSGGWILFVSSEIRRQKELTREINLQTIEILKQMYRTDSVLNEICTIRE